MPKSAPEPLEIDLDAPPPAPALVAGLAWRRLAAAVVAGRCAEAQGWGRLHRQLRALADAEAKESSAESGAVAPTATVPAVKISAAKPPAAPRSAAAPSAPDLSPGQMEVWLDAVLAGQGAPPAPTRREDALFAQAGRAALTHADPPIAPPLRAPAPLAVSRPPAHALQRFEGSTLSGAFSAAVRG